MWILSIIYNLAIKYVLKLSKLWELVDVSSTQCLMNFSNHLTPQTFPVCTDMCWGQTVTFVLHCQDCSRDWGPHWTNSLMNSHKPGHFTPLTAHELSYIIVYCSFNYFTRTWSPGSFLERELNFSLASTYLNLGSISFM